MSPFPLQERAGQKGFGLFANQDLKEGQFVVEYIGEVRLPFPPQGIARTTSMHCQWPGNCCSSSTTIAQACNPLQAAAASCHRVARAPAAVDQPSDSP